MVEIKQHRPISRRLREKREHNSDRFLTRCMRLVLTNQWLPDLWFRQATPNVKQATHDIWWKCHLLVKPGFYKQLQTPVWATERLQISSKSASHHQRQRKVVKFFSGNLHTSTLWYCVILRFNAWSYLWKLGKTLFLKIIGVKDLDSIGLGSYTTLRLTLRRCRADRDHRLYSQREEANPSSGEWRARLSGSRTSDSRPRL